MQITTMDGLVPKITQLSLNSMQLSWDIARKKQELDNLPEVVRLRGEIRELEKSLNDTSTHIEALKDEWKNILLSAWLKEFTALDGTKVALSFTPWALVVEDGAKIPDEYYKVKTTRDLDKKALKDAITAGTFYDDKVFIQKDVKLLIKQ